MKKLITFLIITICPLFAFQKSHATLALVTKVIDGDTVELDISGVIMRARLAYIDAPEMDQKRWGALAKLFVMKLLSIMPTEFRGFLGEAQVISVGIGSFNRPLVLLFSPSGICINLALVEVGLAETYITKDILPPWEKVFLYLEAEARNKKLGIWGDDEYISPREWRKKKEK
jgi:endonuclease YncB( thermonuclease family)